MLLLIDFLMLRSREYQTLLQLYQEWEVNLLCVCVCVCVSVNFGLLIQQWLVSVFQEHRNLSQLPNFSFSTAICHFYLSQQEDAHHDESNKHRDKADQMLQDALIMFPGG